MLPPGEGPKLEFVQAESNPFSSSAPKGVWFQGAMYVASEGQLLRTSDGFTWDVVPGYSPIGRSGDGDEDALLTDDAAAALRRG